MTISVTIPVPRPDQLPRARRATVARPSVSTIDVFVALAADGGFAGWALQVESREPVAGRVPGGRQEAARAVLGQLEGINRTDDTLIAVHSASSVLVSGAGSLPGVLAYPISLAARDDRRQEVVRRAEAELAGALADAPRLEVAVDGSWGRGTRSAGAAFLAADGTHGSRAYRGVGTSVVPELRAIRLALSALPAGRRLTIRCDSRTALSWIDDPARARPELHDEVDAILRLLVGRDVQFRWVKAHRGAGLHDGADRLAVAARRAREAGLGDCAPARQAGHIVAESLAAHVTAASDSAATGAGAVAADRPTPVAVRPRPSSGLQLAA